jgi:4-hydroxy-tetrahydrodipicolinate synthase
VRLANDFANVVAIKEAAGDIVQAMQLLKNKPEDFLVIGDDMIALPMVLAWCRCYLCNRFFPKNFQK